MKLITEFQKFLNDTVNLNDTRLSLLETRVTAIKNFLQASDWGAPISSFVEQGSWAHKTIIRPVDGGEFDADFLVKVRPVDGWDAAKYVKELGRVFRDSARYGDKVHVYDFCVTITYADECQIDIAPLVSGRIYQPVVDQVRVHCIRYETTKAIAAIPVSSKHYLRMNDELSREWDRRRKTLGF